MQNEILRLKKKRIEFNIARESKELSDLMKELPSEDEVVKIVSDGRLSSIAFIKYVADRTKIKDLKVSTLRVGKKQAIIIDRLASEGKIDNAVFVVGSVLKNDSKVGKSYQYYDILLKAAEKNGWKVVVKNNHSKILLFDTENGKYVLETSSNLNECPNIEQFSFQKSDELYRLYLKVFEEVLM